MASHEQILIRRQVLTVKNVKQHTSYESMPSRMSRSRRAKLQLQRLSGANTGLLKALFVVTWHRPNLLQQCSVLSYIDYNTCNSADAPAPEVRILAEASTSAHMSST